MSPSQQAGIRDQSSETRLENPGARILVVEDEHVVALDIALRLERMGHQPTVVYSGEDALAAAATSALELVLMDIKLKGALDGIEAARTLRAQYELPTIYLTAYADEQTLDRARTTEPYGYILKPFQERELGAAIQMALERHTRESSGRAQQRLQQFLTDSSAQLGTSLDYHSVVRGAVELVVPRYADWCSIQLEERNDLVPTFSYELPAHEDHEGQGGSPGWLVEQVERTRHPEILAAVPSVAEVAAALGQRHSGVLEKLGARSAICCALFARGEVLGAISLAAGRTRPHYTEGDLALAEDFTSRVAKALDNALLYRAAERAIRMRDDVLAIVSHDLRSPLATILLHAEAMAANPTLEKVGLGIVRSARRMDRLIGDLLDASAMHARRLALDLGVHCAAEIAIDALDMFRSQAEVRRIVLVEDIADEGATVCCDRDRLIQVLSNLLSNALKFTPTAGRVTVRVAHGSGRIRFEVADTGPGIAPEQVPHLFDRYWRGNTRKKGAGLGLFIAQGIVGAHGGKLEVDTSLGAGSRFFFELPKVT